MAAVALHDGDFPLAIASAARAVELREKEGTRPYLEAASRFLLARALWNAAEGEGRDRARARALAERAEKDLEEVGPETRLAYSVQSWLEAHSPPD